MIRVAAPVTVLIVWMLGAPAPGAQGPDTVLRGFQARLDAYIQVHRRVEGPIPPLAASQDMDEVHRLMSKVREGINGELGDRPQGTVITPEIVLIFRREIAACLRVDELEEIQADFVEHSPGKPGALRMNHPLPEDTPVIPVPPRLLARLPVLPPELRYVIFAKALVLWDHHADMVVDIAPLVLDPAAYRTTGTTGTLAKRTE
jgi:hypothetical protein